jgi:heme/copper-type cytochrome/quinol oxidase subunit 2
VRCDTRAQVVPALSQPHISAMKTAAVIGSLLVILALAIAAAVYTWPIGDAEMSGHGYSALIIGVVFTLVVGCGLMALVFYSSRSGHDEPPKFER